MGLKEGRAGSYKRWEEGREVVRDCTCQRSKGAHYD
jgi:hypothetical protein